MPPTAHSEESGPEDQPGEEQPGLEEQILGDVPSYDAAEVAAVAGVDLEQARRLWRALGFPEVGTERAFTASDANALSTLVRAVEAGLADFDHALELTRALGQTMARLADWEVTSLAQQAEELADATSEYRTEHVIRLIDEFGQPFETLLVYAWRRHLTAAVARLEAMSANEEEPNTIQVTVGFADIVSFTALSNELTRDRIGDLVELFESRCADVVAEHRGRVIKSLGDSVLFVNEDPVAAYETADGIISLIGRDSRLPDVRLGLATGPVVVRLGDVFGPPVNMAARLTGVARRNRTIVDEATAEALPDDEFETRPLPARPVRGFGLVEPVAVRRL